ncbi:helix-turn-helix domain-containing protein [Actinophytocola sp.]|uniref:nSTAND1 domain-containing NTPase n=1 Tax=Actinophytocola sp. TaxID=1872138 RepID=UPI002ED0CDCF
MPRPERPVDPAEGAIQEFAVTLRELRERAGGPTYRSLADRTGLSVSTLADAAGGRRLPTLAVAVAYAVACGGDEHEWAARWRAVAAGQASPERAPYRGMAGFRGEDADLFFGRERLVAELADRVRRFPVTVVLGASGAGKTSLLAAGLVPALAELRPVIMTPGACPVAPEDPELLIVDQFEELYTLCAEADRVRFLDDLLSRSDLRLVVSVRADYYGRLAEHPALADALRTNQMLVGPMDADELRDAVTRPAAAVGLSVERALVATVLQEAKGRAGVLPLLSHAMLETWRRRRGAVLTLAGFEAAGGIDGAVVRTAEEVYGALDPVRRKLAAEVLLRLLAIDDTITRRRVDLGDVVSVDPGAGAVLDRLADARLVTIDSGTVEIAHDAMLTAWPRLRAWIDDHRDAVRAHRKISEAARIWVESDRDPSALATGARLTLMKAHTSALAGILRLNRVEKDFLGQSDTQAQRARHAARRRTLRQRLLVLASVLAVVAAAVFATVADEARRDAVAARDVMLSQRIASTAQQVRVTDPAVAAQLSIAAYRLAPTSEARSALLESSATPLPARYPGGGSAALAASSEGVVAVGDSNGWVLLLARSGAAMSRLGSVPPTRENSRVNALTFFPGGRILAVGYDWGEVRLWDVSSPTGPRPLASLASGDAAPEDIAVSPSGTEIAVARAGEVARWAVDTPKRLRELPSLLAPARVRSVAYSPSGDRLAFGSESGAVHVWSVADPPAEVAVLPSADRPAPVVWFSPDGQLPVRAPKDATVPEEDTIKLWDVSSSPPRPGRPLGGLFEFLVTTASLSPDGRYLLAGSTDSTIYLLETATWTVVRSLPHPEIVNGATFTGDGSAVVTVTSDGTVRRWDMRNVAPIRGPASIGGTRFSADGTRLAVFAGGDVSVWDTSDLGAPVLLTRGLTGPFSGAGDISRDGRLLAAGTLDGDVLLYDLADPVRPRRIDVLGGQARKVDKVVFSPDGTTLAAGGEDTSVRIWALTPGGARLASVFAVPGEAVLDLSWRPSGGDLAVASADGHVYLLDVADPESPRQMARIDAANNAVFSRDGTLLATGGPSGGVQIWDVRDPAAPRRLGATAAGATGRILELSFHPHENLLAASVIDGTVSLWDISDPTRPTRTAVLANAGSPLNTAVFHPAADLLAAGGDDRVVRTWHTDESAVIADICASIGDPITQREWRTHVPDVPYTPPCR